jgi:hypothetical protein
VTSGFVIGNGEARAFTRNRFDWSDYYHPIVEAAGKLHCRSAVIDGEVVALDDAGPSDFRAIKPAVVLASRGLVFIAFHSRIKSLPTAELLVCGTPRRYDQIVPTRRSQSFNFPKSLGSTIIPGAGLCD